MTNAERLQRAAQAELDDIRQRGRVGKEREDRAARTVYDLISHARFLTEKLPGVEIRPSGSTWIGTGYRTLQRIAKG